MFWGEILAGDCADCVEGRLRRGVPSLSLRDYDATSGGLQIDSGTRVVGVLGCFGVGK